jgi:hypothetical protein
MTSWAKMKSWGMNLASKSRDEPRRYANNPLLTLKFQPRAVSPRKAIAAALGLALARPFRFCAVVFDALTFHTFKSADPVGYRARSTRRFYTDGKP